MSDDQNVYEWLVDRNMRARYEPYNMRDVVHPQAGTISGGPFDGAEIKIGLANKTHDMTGMVRWDVWTGPYFMTITRETTVNGNLWTIDNVTD